MPHHTYADLDLNRTFHIHQHYDVKEEAAIAREMHVDPWRGYTQAYVSLHPVRLVLLLLVTLSTAFVLVRLGRMVHKKSARRAFKSRTKSR